MLECGDLFFPSVTFSRLLVYAPELRIDMRFAHSAPTISFEMRLVLVPVPNIQGTAYAHMRNISPYLPFLILLEDVEKHTPSR